MKKVRFVECLIPLLPLSIYSVNSTNAKSNPKISTNSAIRYKNVLSRLEALPCENLTEGIRNYNGKFNTNIFGEVILIAENLKNDLSSDEYNYIIQSATNTFCLYTKNLENPDNTDFEINEQKLKMFKEKCIYRLVDVLSKNRTSSHSEEKNSSESTLWDF